MFVFLFFCLSDCLFAYWADYNTGTGYESLENGRPELELTATVAKKQKQKDSMYDKWSNKNKLKFNLFNFCYLLFIIFYTEK